MMYDGIDTDTSPLFATNSSDPREWLYSRDELDKAKYVMCEYG